MKLKSEKFCGQEVQLVIKTEQVAHAASQDKQLRNELVVSLTEMSMGQEE